MSDPADPNASLAESTALAPLDLDADPIGDAPVVVIDPVIPEDPPPPTVPDGPIPAETTILTARPRFHRVKLYRSRTTLTFQGVDVGLVRIPRVELLTQDDPTNIRPSGFRRAEYQSSALEEGEVGTKFHSVLEVTHFAPSGTTFRILHRFFGRAPRDTADEPARAFAETVFRSGIALLRVRFSDDPDPARRVLFAWRRFNNGSQPIFASRDLLYQLTPIFIPPGP